jgi:hypothetical protein
MENKALIFGGIAAVVITAFGVAWYMKPDGTLLKWVAGVTKTTGLLKDEPIK